MKKLILILVALALYSNESAAQKNKKTETDTLLKELADNSCKCIDSISAYDKTNDAVALEISECINKNTEALHIGKQLMNTATLKQTNNEKNNKTKVDITINLDKESTSYKESYYELERYLMSNCSEMKVKAASSEKQNENSVSNNKKAREFYSIGQKESTKGNYEKAAENFEKAVKEDPKFAFAWDNLGISYRQLNQIDKAIEAYSKSIALDPTGTMPLQNIAVAYIYKKEYHKAIEAYEKLATVEKNNPEVQYGIGNIYTNYLKEYEKGLDSMCKAYNLYVDQKSPYRTDAETIISMIYAEMKKQGKEEQFNTILKNNHITQN